MTFTSPNVHLFGNEQESDTNHVMTCDSLAMASIGLNSFSLGELQNWLADSGNSIDVMGMPLSGDVGQLLKDSRDYSFSYWRTSGRNGEYIEFDEPLGTGMNWSYESYSTSDLGFSTGNPVVELIEMNDQVVSLLRDDPDGSGWTTQDQARIELLRDIKSSKKGCVKWSAYTEVYGSGETADYSLYLFDDTLKKNSSRSVTLSDLKIVAPRVDNAGRVYLHKEDGEVTEVTNPDHPYESIATSINLSYNELTGKWESGTPQVLARLSTSIESASGVELSDLVSDTTENLLDPFLGQGVKTGSAIPIRMQNANPLQWSPEYKVGASGDKTQVKVYNISTRAWASGEMVVLNKIDGVWHPLSFGSEETSTVTITPDNGEWEFTNLAATVESYFRSSAGEQFRYDEYEEAFHRAYYDNDPLNSGVYQNADMSYLDVDDTFVQITSWDMMGANVGGLRAENGIATTQFAEKANGDPLGDNGDGKFVQGVHSSNFFGCVFPDGYNTEGKYAEYMTTTHPDLYGFGLDHDDHFVDVPSTLRVFTPNSDSIADPAAGSMFNGDDTLRHLPADIATNASVSGVNGRPLLSVRRLPVSSGSLAFHVDTNLASLRASNWIARDSDYESAFDLKPVNPSKVQFRPLKVETYAAFEHVTYASATGVPSNTKGIFGGRSWTFVDSQTPPLANEVVNRLNTGHVGYGPSGLRYADEISTDLRSDNAKYPNPYWDLWSDERPAGAIGVIGAVSTATAESSIRFNADCFLGMRSWFINGSFYPSWGGNGGNGPHNSNTSMLYARIYHHWDRNLTVYDPRFFAVHHFNIGFDNLSTTDTLSVDIPVPTDGGGEMSDGDVVSPGNGVLPQENWVTDKSRRGALLPYKYEYKTIGVWNESITAGGSGYSATDEFTTSGGAGSNVAANPIVNGAGAITGFTITDYGDGFAGEDFGTTPSVRIVPVNVTGTGFDGYFTTGVVRLKSGEDTKPEVATTDELLQLTPNPPLGNNGDVVNELDELRSVEAQLSNKSSDNQYDIFYHFHNDISHTFADSWASPNAYEQAVTLEVVPL